MKKKYVKPQIYIEKFSLCTNIAGDCESIVGNPSKEVCAVLGTGGIAIFDGGIKACDFTPEEQNQEADKWNGFCYHLPTDDKELFNS